MLADKYEFNIALDIKSEIEKIISNDLTVGICSKQFVNELKKYNHIFKVHIEIETGMGRTGFYDGGRRCYSQALFSYRYSKANPNSA